MKIIEGREMFRRSERNPLITYKNMPYSCNIVFNPGATTFEGDTLLLLRVEDLEGRSHLTVARSSDGVTDWRIESKPFMSPQEAGTPYED